MNDGKQKPNGDGLNSAKSMNELHQGPAHLFKRGGLENKG